MSPLNEEQRREFDDLPEAVRAAWVAERQAHLQKQEDEEVERILQRLLAEEQAAKEAALGRMREIPADIHQASQISGLFVVAPSGWGKSRLLGRNICYVNAREGIGTVVIDVVGGTIDNALDKVLRQESDRAAVEERIRYCNMAGEGGYATSWPMLYRKKGESLYQASQRAVDLLAKMDPSFTEASIQGFKRAAAILTPIAMVLLSLDLPIITALDILASPEKWKQQISAAGMRDPEARETAAEVLAFLDLKDWKREERSEPLRNRLALLKYDPVSKAMFNTKTPSIDWEEVAYKGLQVYIDLSNETSDMAREMKLFWVWQSVYDYIKSRGSRGKAYYPLAVVIDELTFFVETNAVNTDVLVRDFRELIQGRRRNANIWLTVATQDIQQLPEELIQACVQLGSHLYGRVLDFETALDLAKRWYKADPHKVKYWQNVWVTDSFLGIHEHKVIDQNPLYMTLDEQEYLNSLHFRELDKGMWLFAQSPGEGEYPTELEEIPTHHIDEGQYPQEVALSEFRAFLMQRDGIPLRTLESHPNLAVAEPETALQPPQHQEHPALSQPDTLEESVLNRQPKQQEPGIPGLESWETWEVTE